MVDTGEVARWTAEHDGYLSHPRLVFPRPGAAHTGVHTPWPRAMRSRRMPLTTRLVFLDVGPRQNHALSG